ncbi:hypothetical protein [Saliphagus sp. LR7]|uniref:DUF7344 domain-containing protein n=1 Tax=Saliphagus sp. LR7 TaxID=2282654 RepID=UPI001300AFCA|nr:hypothetical protein [Saliphagus sp. LR7]
MTHLNQREADRTLEILANRHCRMTLLHFQTATENVISIQDLATAITTADEIEQTRVHLQHSTLPRLEDAGLVEYDSRSDTVRYHGDQGVEELLDAVIDCLPGEQHLSHMGP